MGSVIRVGAQVRLISSLSSVEQPANGFGPSSCLLEHLPSFRLPDEPDQVPSETVCGSRYQNERDNERSLLTGVVPAEELECVECLEFVSLSELLPSTGSNIQESSKRLTATKLRGR